MAFLTSELQAKLTSVTWTGVLTIAIVYLTILPAVQSLSNKPTDYGAIVIHLFPVVSEEGGMSKRYPPPPPPKKSPCSMDGKLRLRLRQIYLCKHIC